MSDSLHSSRIVKTTRQNPFPARNKGYVSRLIFRIFSILGISFFLALAAYFANPNAPRYGGNGLKEGEILLENVQSGSIWVDARSQAEYVEGHVKGAINVNENSYFAQIGAFLDAISTGKPAIVYCAAESCDSSFNVMRMLKRETGYPDIYVLHGGWLAIKEAKLPLETGYPNYRLGGSER